MSLGEYAIPEKSFGQPDGLVEILFKVQVIRKQSTVETVLKYNSFFQTGFLALGRLKNCARLSAAKNSEAAQFTELAGEISTISC